MKLRVKLLGISSGGKPIVILNSEDAEELGIKGMDRVVLKYDKTEVTAIVNLSSTVVSKGEIGVYEELDHIRLKEGKLI
ncbi:MAG TPA: thymidine phosphorylase, partial [Candidatus Aenigmarchaeota archaeon]|nr:thymidine phosphorylase [Candidatus Aenigmarchaeota archaeon]